MLKLKNINTVVLDIKTAMLSAGYFGLERSDLVMMKRSDSDDESGQNSKRGKKRPHNDNNTTKIGHRQRAKFIRKVACEVCGDLANDHVHYGAVTCYSCRAFFRRSVTSSAQYACAKNKDCPINKETRKQCQFCRLAQCVKVGMKSTWVMTEEEKREKREAAIAKRRLRQMGGNPNLTTSIQTPSYAKKRAKPTVKRRSEEIVAQNFFPVLNEELENNNKDNDDDPEEIVIMDEDDEEEEDFVTALTKHSVTQACADLQNTSAESSAVVPVNFFREDPVRNERHNLSMTFTMEEEATVQKLVNLEAQSRHTIPVSLDTMKGIMNSIQTGAPLAYLAAKEGYNTCVQRIAYFVSKLDAFREFESDDRRALLSKNTHMVVNIKSARLLCPQNTLQKQIVYASNAAVSAQEAAARLARLEYHQVFRSPWCCGADIEERYQSMMEDIFNLEMDDVTCVLMAAMAMFASNGQNSQPMICHSSDINTNSQRERVKDRLRASKCQEVFMHLLHRYLKSRVGNDNAVNLMPRYIKILAQLEEMTEIILDKRLPF